MQNILQVNVSQAWGILAAIAIILMPLIYEGLDIHRAFRARRRLNEPKKGQTEMSVNSQEALQRRREKRWYKGCGLCVINISIW